MKKKQISASDIQGDRGIALIHRIVNSMGLVWNQIKLEAGIDGIIEIRNPATSEVSNCIIQVQSKAGPSYFRAETESTFDLYCDERDLDYWLSGNAPVILVVSRPDDDEAYWVAIKEYFGDPIRRKEKKIVFDKSSNRFDATSRDVLARLALPTDSGLYLPALPTSETLKTNLLPLIDYPKRLYRAKTWIKYHRQVREMLKKHVDVPPNEWYLHSGMIHAFHDLTLAPWPKVCLENTTENLRTDDWAFSEDVEVKNIFTCLFWKCVEELLYRQGVMYSRNKEHYFYRATADFVDRKVDGLTVFKAYTSKTTPGRIAFYRHRATKLRPLRFERQWYVEITPSYHFTIDGVRLSRFFEERLTRIKQIERQNKVHLRQVLLWETVLKQAYLTALRADSQQQSLFDDMTTQREYSVEPYPHLAFGDLVHFTVDWGVPEGAWLPLEADDTSEVDLQQGKLFDL